MKLAASNQFKVRSAPRTLGPMFGGLLLLQGVANATPGAQDNPAAIAMPESREIVAAVPRAWPPQYSVDENGKPTGFAIDVMNEVAKRAQVNVTYKILDTFSLASGVMKRHEADIIPNSGITPDRSAGYLFTAPVESFNVSIFVRRDTRGIEGLQDLAGRKVGVVSNNVSEKLMKRHPDIHTVSHPDLRTALFDLLSGQRDAIVFPQPVLMGMARQIGVEERIKVVGAPLAEIKRAIQIQKDMPGLAATLDKAVRSFVSTQEYQRIYVKWYGTQNPLWTGNRIFWAMVVLLVALLGAMGLWRYHSVVRFNNALRESEQRVRQSEERLRTFIDHVPALVSLKDLDGRYLLMNSQYTKEFGVDATDGKGKDAGALFPAELVKSLEDQEKKVLQARSQVAREQILPHLDGPHVHLCTKFPVMGLSGSIDAIGTISTNITEHKLAEEALAASEARFRDFAEASSDWYWEMDEDLRFSYFSDHFTEVTGVDAAELLGKSREESGIPNVDSEAWQSHLEALENRKPFRNFIHPRPGPDGATVWLSVSGIPYYDKNGAFKGFRGTGNNVTELVAAQRSADQARAEAEAANRAKSNFLASMSHELRTPLNAILGFSEILKEQILGPHVNGKYHEYSADIHSSASYLLELINDLLDISTIEAGKRSLDKEPLAVKDLIDDCMRIFIERAHSKDIELATDVPENNPMLYADKNAIRQILINLLTNAVKFTPNSGSISVLVNSTNKCTEFVVCDNGIRISSGRLSTITDPFIRGELSPDKTDAGWGLGLSIVRSLVELHKGEIDIESQVGKGTSVTIRIPNERCAEMAAA